MKYRAYHLISITCGLFWAVGCSSAGQEHLDIEKVVADAAYGLSGVAATAAPGTAVQVQWAAPSNHSVKDWIGLYQVGAANTAFKSFVYVPAGTAGTVSLTLPANATGNWEFRYFANNLYDLKATSAAFAAQVPQTSYALTGAPATAVPGSPVQVQFSVPANHSTKDWVGLYQAGSANTAFKGYAYVPAGATGTIQLTLPANATGNWEFRYFINGGYGLKATSAAIATQQAATGISLTDVPAQAAPGASVSVKWTAPANHATNDWVGLYQVGAANTAFKGFAYVPAGATGTLSLKLPTNATGNWEFRYLVNGGYVAKAQSSSFAITAPTSTILRHANVCTGSVSIYPTAGEGGHWIGVDFGSRTFPLTVRSVQYEMYEGTLLPDMTQCNAKREHKIQIFTGPYVPPWYLSTPPANPTVLAEVVVPAIASTPSSQFRTVAVVLPTPIVIPANTMLYVAVKNSGEHPNASCFRLCDTDLSFTDFWSNANAAPYAWSAYGSYSIPGRTSMRVYGEY